MKPKHWNRKKCEHCDAGYIVWFPAPDTSDDASPVKACTHCDFMEVASTHVRTERHQECVEAWRALKREIYGFGE